MRPGLRTSGLDKRGNFPSGKESGKGLIKVLNQVGFWGAAGWGKRKKGKNRSWKLHIREATGLKSWKIRSIWWSCHKTLNVGLTWDDNLGLILWSHLFVKSMPFLGIGGSFSFISFVNLIAVYAHRGYWMIFIGAQKPVVAGSSTCPVTGPVIRPVGLYRVGEGAMSPAQVIQQIRTNAHK